ncbi:MAG: sugar ABC transporter permease [Devosia sp. 67-54]|nr:ABC transporter permease [Devosia sp.]OJX18565.1 MAG: sugar ABC transporter permease [Devosia sp. 67-54]
MLYATPVGAVLLTMLVGAIIFTAIGYNGFGAVYQVFIAPLALSYKWGDIAVKASPLILIGVGLAVGNRAAIWNIGAEGQYIVGALAGTGIGILTKDMHGPWILPLMLVAGMVGGAAWGAVPALLRNRFNVNEVLSSLMLTYVAVHLMNQLVTGPWKDPMGFSFPQTALITADQMLPILVPGTYVHLGIVITLIIAVALWFLMSRSLMGFQVRVVGSAPSAARHGGFSQKQTVWLVFLLSGALAGLAGIFEVTGPFQQMSLGFPQNYGFTAIIVAFLGRLNPLGVILAGIVLAITYVGGDLAQSVLQLPNASKGIFQALMLFFLLASDILIRYRVRLVGAPAPAAVPARSPAE